ncbi:MAG: hypothetical protein KAR20_14635 [Candidatus Heimdallarchaeota archaeon]|nr:hypothetical protein [Candidatus Heimdallarchaeota archaeon]
MSAIPIATRIYRDNFKDDKLISALRCLKETRRTKDKTITATDLVESLNLLRNVEALIDKKKKKEAIVALVTTRLRFNGLNASVRARDKLEKEFVRLRVGIDTL